MSKPINILQQEAIALLQSLIAAPSFSKEEQATAEILKAYFTANNIPYKTIGNNIYCPNKYYDAQKQNILLNSHHDTVKPNKGYTLDPFTPTIAEGKLFGLGSNDAGGCLVSLIATFLYFYDAENLPYNMVLGISAEEEISGKDGIELLLTKLPDIAFGIVGEPTLMQMAVAEKGLMVIDAVATGVAGHAARNEGVNAIDIAMLDIATIKTIQLKKVSELLGPCKLSVTVINTDNKQHNVVPAQCSFVVDVRVNELYTHEEILEILRNNLQSKLTPRGFRMRSSVIDLAHPIVQAGLQMNKTYYGSPTTSDKALMPFTTLKIGPGDSARSHSADEFIYISEIENGITDYIELLTILFENTK